MAVSTWWILFTSNARSWYFSIFQSSVPLFWLNWSHFEQQYQLLSISVLPWVVDLFNDFLDMDFLDRFQFQCHIFIFFLLFSSSLSPTDPSARWVLSSGACVIGFRHYRLCLIFESVFYFHQDTTCFSRSLNLTNKVSKKEEIVADFYLFLLILLFP